MPSKRARAYEKGQHKAADFSSVGKNRRKIDYVYHVSTLDYSHLSEADFLIKLPYINNVVAIEIINAYVPANLDSLRGKILKIQVDSDVYEITFEDNMGFSNDTQRLLVIEKILSLEDNAGTRIFEKAEIISSEANGPFKLELKVTPDFQGRTISLVWEGLTEQESLKQTLGFSRAGDESLFDNTSEDNVQTIYTITSDLQCNWKGHNFLILRTPSVNIDCAFAAENPPFHHTNVLAILHTPHEQMGVHFNKDWFREVLVRNEVSSLHTFRLQIFHEDGRLVHLNGGQFFFTFKITADSY